MITATTFYILFGILAAIVVALMFLFLWFIKNTNEKIESKKKVAIDESKRYTNNEIAKLDRATLKYSTNEKKEVVIYTSDGKTEIGIIGNITSKSKVG